MAQPRRPLSWPTVCPNRQKSAWVYSSEHTCGTTLGKTLHFPGCSHFWDGIDWICQLLVPSHLKQLRYEQPTSSHFVGGASARKKWIRKVISPQDLQELSPLSSVSSAFWKKGFFHRAQKGLSQPHRNRTKATLLIEESIFELSFHVNHGSIPSAVCQRRKNFCFCFARKALDKRKSLIPSGKAWRQITLLPASDWSSVSDTWSSTGCWPFCHPKKQ